MLEKGLKYFIASAAHEKSKLVLEGFESTKLGVADLNSF